MKPRTQELIRCLAAVALIAVTVYAAYVNDQKGVFIFDDDHYIVQNPTIKHIRWENPSDFADDILAMVHYDPARTLTSITFAINFRFSEKEKVGGAESVERFTNTGFHVVNNWIHFLTAVLAFFVIRKIIKMYRGDAYKGWAGIYFPALIAALLFAACPVNSEAVTYIVQRAESMVSMFMLAGLLFFLSARDYQNRHYQKQEAAKSSRKQVREAPRFTFAWILAGIPLMVVIFMVMAGAFIPSGENVSPETVKAAYNKAVLTTCGVGVIYLLVIAAGIAAFPHRIQWGGDLRLAAAWVFFGLALLSKQIAVIFPFMLLLVEVAVLRAGRKGHMVRVLKYHALFLATLAVLGLLWLALQGQPSNPALPQEGGPDMRYFTQQVSNSVILKYVGLIFVPLRLNIDPDIGLFGERPGDHALTAQFAALMLLMVFAILLHKRSRLPAFGLFWFFLLIVPTCTFFKLSDIMAEHRVYLAGLGIFMAVGVAVTEAVRMLPTQAGRIAAAAIAALVIGGIILADIATIQKRNTKFWSAVTLWGDTIKNSPDKARPYTGVGFEYMNRGSVESVKGAFDAAKDALDKDRDVANPARIEAHRADFAGVDRDLRSLALNLAAAKAFLETGELYDQADLWKPKLLLMPDPRVAYDRFGRQQLSRVFNNLGVVYSYKSEMLGWQEFYAPLLLLKEKEIAADRGDAWAGALKYYALALGMNSGGVEALVNSSKIWWRIANNCYTKAQNDPVNRDEYLEQFQDDAAFAAALVLRAVIIRPDSPIALPQMVVVHYFMARYYYGPPGTLPLVSTAMLHPLPQEEREKRGLMHWRYFKWVSSRYPVSNNQAEHNAIMQMMMSAIMSLEGKYRDEPDPTAYLR